MRRPLTGLILVLLLVACARPATPTPMDDPGVWYVEVTGEGGYWLGPDRLREMNVGLSPETPPSLRFSWFDRELPHVAMRSGDGWGVLVFAPDRGTRYSRRTALRLETNVPGTEMRAEQSAPPSGPAAAGVASAGLEEDLHYLPQAETEIPWLWESLFSPSAVTHTVILTGALPGTITATLHIWSHSRSAANPDHLLRLHWDGRSVGEWAWDGEGMQHLVAAWDESNPESEHTLVIEAPRLPDVDVAVVWIDRYELEYRTPGAADGVVVRAEGTSLQVLAADEAARVLDVTDPFDPIDLGAIPGDGRVGTVSGRRYWIGVPEKATHVALVRPARQVDLDQLAGVAYLVLAPPVFHDALQPLLELREGQGLRVAVVDIHAVYDALGTGRPDPAAVRALVQRLPSLRYLLVVGDGSAEPWAYDGEESALRVVAPFTRTRVLGETPADGLLVASSQDGLDVAVGRWPLNSADQVAAVVEKTVDWEAHQKPPQTIILSDDESQYRSMADAIADLTADGPPAIRLDVGDASSRERLLEALSTAPSLLSFSGHGSLTQLCDERTLTVEDGDSWSQPAIVVAWTCLAGHFVHPVQESMAEAWLRSPRGGAVAFVGPTGETMPGEQQPLADAFYRALADNERLGDAWLSAVQQVPSPDVAWGYLLLGDPALITASR